MLANEVASDSDVSDEDLEFFAEHAAAATGFAQNLDLNGIQRSEHPLINLLTNAYTRSRSKKEQLRLHKLSKPQPIRSSKDDDLPSLDSHSEDENSWSSDIGSDSEDDPEDIAMLSDASIPSSSSSRLPPRSAKSKVKENEEMPYERLPRKRMRLSDSEDEGISRLPIKSQDGKVHRFEKVVPRKVDRKSDDRSSEEESELRREEPVRRDDVATGARFGRPAVVDVIGKGSRQARIQAAKEQIASICQDIVGDPENSVCSLLLSSIPNSSTFFCKAWTAS